MRPREAVALNIPDPLCLWIHLGSTISLSSPNAVFTNPFTKEAARLALEESTVFAVLKPEGDREGG